MYIYIDAYRLSVAILIKYFILKMNLDRNILRLLFLYINSSVILL